ncbi:hypothetical protein TNCV_1748781 [Trichonephila clavipes]|nr:hypothetical protein TNCV_1748781 [Trichonephila clavipes]
MVNDWPRSRTRRRWRRVMGLSYVTNQDSSGCTFWTITLFLLHSSPTCPLRECGVYCFLLQGLSSVRQHLCGCVFLDAYVSSLMVRSSDSRLEALGSMPPNTLRVHTEYVFVKSMDPKVLWAKSRVQGTEEYFRLIQFHA